MESTELLNQIIKDEIKFCKSIDAKQNERGVFIYKSADQRHSFNLPFILKDYKEWLIENGIVTEIK